MTCKFFFLSLISTLVICFEESSACTYGSLRLTGNSNLTSAGRLEICINNTWGTICDDFFGSINAQVACRQLGYSTTGAVAITTYEAGTGTIWLDNVQCNGSESSLLQCNHNNIGTHNCVHHEDVGVRCYELNEATFSTITVPHSSIPPSSPIISLCTSTPIASESNIPTEGTSSAIILRLLLGAFFVLVILCTVISGAVCVGAISLIILVVRRKNKTSKQLHEESPKDSSPPPDSKETQDTYELIAH